MKKLKVAFLHNIISPYRNLLFEGLSNHPSIDLFVFFCSDIHKIRKWEVIHSNSYNYEIFGITVLEACACGTPVIVTDKCGIADFIEKTGHVVKCNKEELKYAIFKILSDEKLRRRFREDGIKLVRKDLGWDKVVAEVETIYARYRKAS